MRFYIALALILAAVLALSCTTNAVFAAANNTFFSAIRDSTGAVTGYTVVEMGSNSNIVSQGTVPVSSIRLGATTADGNWRVATDQNGKQVGFFSLNVDSAAPSSAPSAAPTTQTQTSPSPTSRGGSGFLGPIVPACAGIGTKGTAICQACDLVQLAENILRAMVTLSVFAASIMFAYAGFLYVSAASNPSNLESAKKIFSSTLIGIVFVVGAYLIVDLTLKVLTGSPLDAWTKIQCVKAVQVQGLVTGFDVQPDPQTPGVTGTQGSSTASTTAPKAPSPFDLGKGLNNVDSSTNYDPGTGGDSGGLLDAFGKPIVTAQDNINCRNAGGTAASCPPVTVAVPQQSGITKTQNFTWPELAQRYGLPADTVFAPTDHYAPSAGYTTRGTYSVDVARCSSTNWASATGCTLSKFSHGKSEVISTTPTPVPGG
jgi:hypothetical protein